MHDRFYDEGSSNHTDQRDSHNEYFQHAINTSLLTIRESQIPPSHDHSRSCPTYATDTTAVMRTRAAYRFNRPHLNMREFDMYHKHDTNNQLTPYCTFGDCHGLSLLEDVRHILCECPRFTAERSELTNAMLESSVFHTPLPPEAIIQCILHLPRRIASHLLPLTHPITEHVSHFLQAIHTYENSRPTLALPGLMLTQTS